MVTFTVLQREAVDAGNFLIPLKFLFGFAILCRLAIYISYSRPPLSLAGRIVNAKLIIPGYDRIFLTPLALIALLKISEWIVILLPPKSIPLGMALLAACLCGILLNGGPDMRTWALTGHHRVAGGEDVKKFLDYNAQGRAE